MKLLALIVMLLTLSSFASPALPPTFTGLDGKVIKVEKPRVLLYFWATWCAVCEEKLKTTLVEMQKKRPDLQVILLNTETNTAKAVRYLETRGVTMASSKNEPLQKELKVFGVPAWAVYRNGVYVNGATGWSDDQVEKALNIQ
jgi:thiol-disulfide isomerase/thioredoxin